jgi:hypothetical protein
MAKRNQPKIRQRYSIGETYGRSIECLPAAQRFEEAKTAKIEYQTRTLAGASCPFQAKSKCIKKGGICSLRLYQQIGDSAPRGFGPIISTCPQRFLEAGTIFRWIGETLLETPEPIVLNQIGFLDRLRPEEEVVLDEEDDAQDFIGRIDNVLVHPKRHPMHWCAVELQAVYFSGKSMVNEFELFAQSPDLEFPFPAKNHRPDWRSSGPKRLLPQLQTKVPTVRTWGKKMAVVIDEEFFKSLVGLKTVKHVSNAEIVWFIVGFTPKESGWTLVPRMVVYTKLEDSVDALTGGVPLSQDKFENQLREKLRRVAPLFGQPR